MSIKRAVPDIISERIDESRKFYTEFLGFDVAMDMGWVLTFASPSNPTAQITLVRDPKRQRRIRICRSRLKMLTRPMPRPLRLAFRSSIR